MLAFQNRTWPVIGGGGGPTFVKKSSLFDASSAADPLVLSHNMASAGNVLIALMTWESGGTSLEDGNVPTYNGVSMTQVGIVNTSRRHAAIYSIHPNTTGAHDYSFDFPTAGARGAAVRLEEWSGVDTTTIFNNFDVSTSGGASLAMDFTTTDATGVILGVAAFGAEGTAITATTGTLNEEGATGGNSKDIRSGFASIAVASAAATEGITFNQTGNINAAGVAAELNPA